MVDKKPSDSESLATSTLERASAPAYENARGPTIHSRSTQGRSALTTAPFGATWCHHSVTIVHRGPSQLRCGLDCVYRPGRWFRCSRVSKACSSCWIATNAPYPLPYCHTMLQVAKALLTRLSCGWLLVTLVLPSCPCFRSPCQTLAKGTIFAC